jgi:hypothetical protein
LRLVLRAWVNLAGSVVTNERRLPFVVKSAERGMACSLREWYAGNGDA